MNATTPTDRLIFRSELQQTLGKTSNTIRNWPIDMSQHEVASLSCAAAIRARGE